MICSKRAQLKKSVDKEILVYLCIMEKYDKTVLELILPEGILDCFEVTKVEEGQNEKAKKELEKKLFPKMLYVYLDELDNREEGEKMLRPNGFTEATIVKDYPVRNRKLVLYIRRRRYLNSEGKNVILNRYVLATPGTQASVEYGVFFKGGLG